MSNQMAKKKKANDVVKVPSAKELVHLEATAKKLQAMLVEPMFRGWASTGAAAGLRQKMLKINFNTLRNVVDKIPLVNAIITTRCDQIAPFCHTTDDPNEPGYMLISAIPGEDLAKKNDKEKEVLRLLYGFLDQTGYQYDPDREDDFSDYAHQFVRETLTIDQLATELQYNRKGDVIAYWLIDGATVSRTTEEGDFAKNIRFVQQIDDQIVAKYTPEQLLFDYKNKRADILFRGFGYSAVEQCIDLITTILFGYNHIRDQFIKNKIPKGFITIMGDADSDQLDSVRRYWHAAMSGAGGEWNIPIVPSGKDGIGIDFKSIGQNNRDMEYHKLMMFVSSIIAAVFSIDLAEMGIKTDDSQALIGEKAEPRIQASKDRGLRSMLFFLEQHINKILRKATQAIRFKFVGFERVDPTKAAEVRKKRVETDTTVNELRKEDGKEPLEGKYADVVLNPQAVQMIMAEQGAEQMGGEGEEGEEGAEIIDWESFGKSLKSKKDIHITVK